ncbi:hypothetical protein LTR28_000508 [Elasticomyces elasticus]|nr:hypothetical protein LTR28_000508 [Elasticomyces elasticus]
MAPAGYLDRGTELFKKLKSYYTQDTPRIPLHALHGAVLDLARRQEIARRAEELRRGMGSFTLLEVLASKRTA